MKTKINKMSKIGAHFLLMFVAISVLILPAATISYAESAKINRVLMVQENYIDGDGIDLFEPINITETNTKWSAQTILSTESNADYFIYSSRISGQITTRRTITYLNGVSYIGNNTYSVMPDFSEFTPNADYPYNQFHIVMDIPTTEFANYDFIRITNSAGFDMQIQYSVTSGITTILNNKIDTGEYLIVNTLSTRSALNSNPNATMYLLIGQTNGFNSTWNETITFSMEMFNLESADVLTWDDDQIYILTILGCDIIMIIGFVFTTNFIDIQIDRTKPRKTYRRKNRR